MATPALSISANLVFFYYKDLPRAMRFYEDVLGLSMVVDQGFCKIYKMTPHSFVGLVDGENGTHKPSLVKPVILSFVTPDIDAWYAYLREHNVPMLHPIGTSERIGVRGFMALDPEGYVLEFETFLSPHDKKAVGLAA